MSLNVSYISTLVIKFIHYFLSNDIDLPNLDIILDYKLYI